MGKIDSGKESEDIAVSFLEKKGYKIITRNWRFGKKEIDIIAAIDDWLVIVEVKTRGRNTFVRPEDLIPPRKTRFIIDAAEAYIRKHDIDREVRFDVIFVCLGTPEPEIEHIERAFFPTL